MDMRASFACYHCGDAVDGEPVLAMASGAERAFCCAGCAAAAAWIARASLEDYYRLRSASGARVDADAPDFSAWDRDDVLTGHGVSIDGGREITVLTDAMRCAACAWLIDRALRREPGVLDVIANAVTGRITIRWDPWRVALSALMTRLAALGYRPWLAAGEEREREQRCERRRWLLRLGIAGLGAMQAMMFSEALYWDTHGEMAVATRDFFRWVAFLVSTPVVFYSGWPFIEGMLRELRGRRLGMDTLIAGSTLLAWGASVAATLRGGPQVWYDAAVMFVLLLLIARALEQRARGIASAQVDALARARPALATRESPEGRSEQIPVTELVIGDVLRVPAGEAIAADGELLNEAASFDESLLNGESGPVQREPGDSVLAGSLCRDRPIRLRVLRTGSDTWLSQLVRLAEHAQAARPKLVRIADRIASVFVFSLAVCAVGVYAWWRQHDPARAFEVTLAVLVVSCPCALSLAIPVALTTAHGALARMGVLVTRGDAIATLARADRIVFDKTGTLSTGEAHLESIETFGGMSRKEVLQIACALERGSAHPLARAIVSHAAASGAPDCVASEIHDVPGRGIEGRFGGKLWRIGRAQFAFGRERDDGVWLGDGSNPAARFGMRERRRPDAAVAVALLRGQQLEVELCSGDGQAAVANLAEALDIAVFLSRQSPEDKLARIRELQRKGCVVAMIGDGINDAPVLAGADVSLAIGEGSTIAHRAADFVLVGASLLRIPQAIALARRTRAIVRQNLAWAVAYNLVALPLAAMGRVDPWIAALGMATSSLIVTLNALRLARAEH
jgi:Cu2+-exporting ATPase